MTKAILATSITICFWEENNYQIV